MTWSSTTATATRTTATATTRPAPIEAMAPVLALLLLVACRDENSGYMQFCDTDDPCLAPWQCLHLSDIDQDRCSIACNTPEDCPTSDAGICDDQPAPCVGGVCGGFTCYP